MDVVRFFTQLKAKLMPYLYRNAVQTHESGVPMMRSMVLEFPEDRNCHHLATQYFLGDSLLVAPIFNEEGMAEYYLPEGHWTNLLTGEESVGGKWYKEYHNYLSIPLYVKENSILAVGGRNDDAVYDYAEGVTLKVCGLQDGKTAETVVYSCENEIVLTASVARNGESYHIHVETDRPCWVELMNTGIAPVKLNGAANVTVTK